MVNVLSLASIQCSFGHVTPNMMARAEAEESRIAPALLVRSLRRPCRPTPAGVNARGQCVSVVVARNERTPPADQEIEVGAAVGLQHMVDVELPIAAGERWRRPLPALHAVGELGIGDVEMEAP